LFSFLDLQLQAACCFLTALTLCSTRFSSNPPYVGAFPCICSALSALLSGLSGCRAVPLRVTLHGHGYGDVFASACRCHPHGRARDGFPPLQHVIAWLRVALACPACAMWVGLDGCSTTVTCDQGFGGGPSDIRTNPESPSRAKQERLWPLDLLLTHQSPRRPLRSLVASFWHTGSGQLSGDFSPCVALCPG
jgi:hypothetical protein